MTTRDERLAELRERHRCPDCGALPVDVHVRLVETLYKTDCYADGTPLPPFALPLAARTEIGGVYRITTTCENGHEVESEETREWE